MKPGQKTRGRAGRLIRGGVLSLSAVLWLGALSACNNGAVDGDHPPVATDTVPDAFAFAPLSEQPLNSPVQSQPISVSGINAPSHISVSGGTLRLNGQDSSASTVKAGDQVAVKLKTSSQAGTATSAIVTIGGVSASFTATTQGSGGNNPPSSAALRWSDPATWGGQVPAAGQSVTIPANKRITLDVSPPALRGLTIPAGSALEFAEQDLTLTSEWIMVHGELRIGSEAKPFSKRADIVLTNTFPGEDVMGMGDRLLGVMDGTLEWHGAPRLSWTRLSQSAAQGSSTLSLERSPDWRPGDQLTLASTDFNPGQTERVTIASVSGAQVTLTTPLKYGHYAGSTTLAGQTLHQRAEVGLLSRNIRLRASDDASSSGVGAHLMIMGKSVARIEGSEFSLVGQRNTLRRYPVHFHQLGSVPSSYFKSNSVHDSFNRCVVVHGTSDLRVQDNVTYNNVGHCIFLEDGDELNNTLSGNLVTSVRRPDSKKGETPLLPSDQDAAGYWITHPQNTVTGNVAAGVEGFAFWYAFPEHPTGLASSRTNIWNRRSALGIFDNNVAHSANRGLNVDGGPQPDGHTQATYYDPVSDPADPKSAPLPATFRALTAYKNRDHGVWLRGENLTLTAPLLADNAVGATFASDQSTLQGGLIVGETANLGQPESWEKVGEGGRSLPRPWDADFPIRGYQFYDGQVSIQGTAIANFKPNSLRQASGLGYLTENAFALEPQNSAKGIQWLDDSKRVYFPAPQADKDGDKAVTFLDQDGSVTGQAGQFVTGSALLRGAADCRAQADWNASICAGQYARFWLEDVNDGKIGPVKISNSRGDGLSLMGTPDNFTDFHTSVRLGEGYTVQPSATSRHYRLGFSRGQAGQTLLITLPYSGEPALYRDWWIDERNRLKKVARATLSNTTGDSYALENGQLYLKLVVKPERGYAVLDVCASALCQ